MFRTFWYTRKPTLPCLLIVFCGGAFLSLFLLLTHSNTNFFPFLSLFSFPFSIFLFLPQRKGKIFQILFDSNPADLFSMAEEHRCQAPRLCANNCGFFGSPAMQDLCSKCYRDLQLKEQRSSSAKLVLNQTLIPPQPVVVVQPSSSEVVSISSLPAETVVGTSEQPNRCGCCRRRVGLTGFKCRCGLTLCGSHRYPEQHGCGFDFKGMGREQIAKANPVVKGEKLNKI